MVELIVALAIVYNAIILAVLVLTRRELEGVKAVMQWKDGATLNRIVGAELRVAEVEKRLGLGDMQVDQDDEGNYTTYEDPDVYASHFPMPGVPLPEKGVKPGELSDD